MNINLMVGLFSVARRGTVRAAHSLGDPSQQSAPYERDIHRGVPGFPKECCQDSGRINPLLGI